MPKVAWWITLLFLCCWTPAHAALPVPADGVVLRNSGEFYYLIDDSGHLTLDQVRNADGKWRLADVNFRLPRDSFKPVWMHFRIAAPVRDQQLMLFHPMPIQIELDVYLVENGAVVARYETGNSRPFASRPLPYPRYLFPISLHAHAPLDVYVRVRGYPSRTFDFLQLWPERKLLIALPTLDAFEWAAMGVMLVSALAATVVWLFVRERIFGLFALFVASQLINYFTTRGYAAMWLWPNTPAIDVISYPLATTLGMFVNFVFSIAFLKLREQTPRLYRLAKIALLVLAALSLMAPFRPIIVETIGVFLILVLYIFLIGVSYYLFRYGNNRTDAGIFLLCYGTYAALLIMVTVTSLLGSYGWWYSTHLIDIGQLLRILLLAGCLGYRFRQIVRSEESARAEARAKSEFLARMSHEIRTPMNGILGMSELLRDAGLNSTQRRYNDIVYSSATSLLTIINDILDFSKIQAGRMTTEKVPLDIHRLAVDVLTLFRVKADEKNLELLLDIRPDVPAWVMGDPTRIRQILINFLSNAVKFTESGEVRLRLAKQDDQIRIAVADTGPGIPSEVHPRLFDSFMQADTSIARSHGGTGLGLAITLQLAELMGGKVGVQSELGKGSSFWVELPLTATAKQDAAPATLALDGKSILIVDDNIHFCELVAESAKGWRANLQIAHSGTEALARVRELREKHTNFDLISIDLKMPGMNGLELAQALKAECGKALPPLLLLTAAIDIPQSSVQRSAGIVLAQEKPLLAGDLREAFARALGLAAPIAPSTESVVPAEPPAYKLSILVVEDNPTNQLVIDAMMERLGQDYVLATDGAQAVALYKSRHDDFDLVLMDCEMPGMDGFEATRRIRDFERAQRLAPKTIVALTAHTLADHIQQCREAGMDAHLAKPLMIERLHELLTEYSESKAY